MRSPLSSLTNLWFANEDYPVACKSKDLRSATGTGMHFYRKCKHLLCKKCQK